MKLGMYTVPNTNLRRHSLLWDNAKDRDHEEAIATARQSINEIQQIIIKMNANALNYSTDKLIEYFLNQHWDRGIRYTHDAKGHMIPIKKSTRYRVYIPNLFILLYVNETDYKVLRLTPQMHIFPTKNDENLSENLVFHIDSNKMKLDKMIECRSEYDYYKFVRTLIEKPEPVVLMDSTQIKPDNGYEFALFRALCEAYEIPYGDDKAFEQIEYYTMNRIPITRMPHDEKVYEFFADLGIAPRAEELYDDSNYVYIGKESYLETYQEQENDYN